MNLPVLFLFTAPLLAAGFPFQATRNPLDDYEPPARPPLSGNDTHLSVAVNGRERCFFYYQPKGIAPRALVVILHGTTGSGRRIRDFTAYRFDELADQHGLVTIYPDGISGAWDDCRSANRRPAEEANADDAAFLRAAVRQVSDRIKIGHLPHFVTGYSGGGHLALRIAMQDPDQFRAYAVFATSLPAPGHMDCAEPTRGVSLLVMNGTQDPTNPFEGGEVIPPMGPALGRVRSTGETAEYFSRLAAVSQAPYRRQSIVGPDGTSIETTNWKGAAHEVELVVVQGGGHSLPHPKAEFPAAAGPTSKSASGADLIWEFFERHLP